MRHTKIIFKGQEISRTKVKNNIIRVLNQSTAKENNDWYQNANTWCQQVALKYNVPFDSVAGVVASLSPRKEWQLNKRIAIELIETGDCGQIKVFVNKAKDCLEVTGDSKILSVLNGPKIKSFYLNIKYPGASDNVTIDRHAIAVALGRTASDSEQALSEKQYQFFKDCYIWTAETLGLKPLMLQAITWETWKRIK